MLMGTVGNPRTGKTLKVTKDQIKLINIAKQLEKLDPTDKHYYFANYQFFREYANEVTFIEPQDMLRISLNKLYAGVTTLDELWKWVESRGSGTSSNNKILSGVAFESGKSGYDISWTAQLGSSLDKRITLLTNFFYATLTPTEKYFMYAYVSETTRKPIKFRWSKVKASEYYQYYNTQYKVKPIEADLRHEQELIKLNPDSSINKFKPDSNDIPDEDVIKGVTEIREVQQTDEQLILNLKQSIADEITSMVMEQLQQLRKEMEILGKRINSTTTVPIRKDIPIETKVDNVQVDPILGKKIIKLENIS